MRPQLDVGTVAQIRHGLEQRPGIQARTPDDGAARRRPPRPSRPDAASRSHTEPRRRAGSARSQPPAIRVATGSAPECRRADVATASRAGGAAHPDRCTARRPAPGRNPASSPLLRPSTRSTSTGRPRVFSDDHVGAMFGGLHRGDPGTRPGAQRGQQRGLAARAGTQVQPSPGVVGDRRQSQCAGHQLAALVLHQGLAVAHRGQLARGRLRAGTPRTANTGPRCR